MSSHSSLFYDDVNADIAIVGAGIAGLTAAYVILQNHPTMNVLMLEASGRVGGRTICEPLRVDEEESHLLDLGGQWISSQQDVLINLMSELSIATEVVDNKGKVLVDYKGRIYKQHKTKPFDFSNLTAKLELAHFVRKIENLCQEVPTPRMATITMEHYISKNLFYNVNRAIFRLIILMNFGVEPEDITLSFYIFFCVSTHGIANQLSFDRNGFHEFLIRNGAQQICEKIVAKFQHDIILMLNSQVSAINRDRHYVEIVTEQKSRFYCDNVIIAVPPTEILKIKFAPNLPESKIRAFANSPGGNLSKFVVVYDEPFWRSSSYSGDVYVLGNNPHGPIICCFNVTTATSPPLLTGYVRKNGGDLEFSILRHLSRYFGEKALKPVRIIVKEWGNGSPMFCHKSISVIRHAQTNIERIFWTGAETSTEWYGSIAGSVLAGTRVAYELIYETRPASLTIEEIEQLRPRMTEIRRHIKSYRSLYKNIVNPYYQTSVIVLILAFVYWWRRRKI